MAHATPPPPPSSRAKTPGGTKFLLILIPLIIVGGIGFYVFVPYLILTVADSDAVRAAQKVDDMNDLRQIGGLLLADMAGPGKDGRVDVYGVLLENVQDESVLIDICHSARKDRGPSIEEIRAGDYGNFPYVRRKGGARAGEPETPLLWDREPWEGERLVVFNSSAVRFVPEAEFQELLRSQKIQ